MNDFSELNFIFNKNIRFEEPVYNILINLLNIALYLLFVLLNKSYKSNIKKE